MENIKIPPKIVIDKDELDNALNKFEGKKADYYPEEITTIESFGEKYHFNCGLILIEGEERSISIISGEDYGLETDKIISCLDNHRIDFTINYKVDERELY